MPKRSDRTTGLKSSGKRHGILGDALPFACSLTPKLKAVQTKKFMNEQQKFLDECFVAALQGLLANPGVVNLSYPACFLHNGALCDGVRIALVSNAWEIALTAWERRQAK